MILADDLVRYLAAREQQRGERVTAVLGAANPRERRLMREMAVMGYVAGVWSMPGAHEQKIPPDSQILADVVARCLSQSDLYPTTARLERLAMRRERRAGEVAS